MHVYLQFGEEVQAEEAQLEVIGAQIVLEAITERDLPSFCVLGGGITGAVAGRE